MPFWIIVMIQFVFVNPLFVEMNSFIFQIETILKQLGLYKVGKFVLLYKVIGTVTLNYDY